MRLSPLPADQWDDATRDAVAGMLPEERRNPRDAGNILATLVRHPKLARAFLRFSGYLLYGSTLPPRIREQVILRVAHRRGCAYEWSHHVALGKKAGLSDPDIDAVQSGEPNDEFDRAVLGAVDELDEKTNISDQTWAALSERLDEQQRMDLIFTIGGYTALAMALNTFGVEVEAGRKDEEGQKEG
jgi:AhpD family alkylhydroperoxidase